MINVMKAFNVHPSYKIKGDLGVEIEVEGDRLPRPNEYWRSERDGSLRGESMEYVLEQPLSMPDVREALAHLDEAYKNNDTHVHESVRAGVHVHVNVQHLNLVELYTFITAYVILEDLLVNFCGEYREGNLFCLRIKDADYLLYKLEEVARDKNYREFNNDILRYASMNVLSLHKFGSLEFRAMRGTRDLNLIGDWAEILLNLRNVSGKFATPAELYQYASANTPEALLELFLGYFKEGLCDSKDVDTYVLDGLNRAHHLAMNTDWDSFITKEIGGLEFPSNVEFPDVPQEDY